MRIIPVLFVLGALICPASGQTLFSCASVLLAKEKSGLDLDGLEALARQYGVSEEQITAGRRCFPKKRHKLRTRKTP